MSVFTYIKHTSCTMNIVLETGSKGSIAADEEEVNPIHVWYCMSFVEEKARGHLLFVAFVKMPLQFFA